MLIRNSKNPILVADHNLPWCSKKVYNCAIYKNDTTYELLFRAVGDDWISRLGLAESTDGVSFRMVTEPVMSPVNDLELKGCEDPRMVRLNGQYYVTYTAFDGVTARAALACSDDLRHFTERRLLFPVWNKEQRETSLPSDWSKAAALFPQQLNGRYYLFLGDNHIWAATSSNLIDWELTGDPVLMPRPNYFDAAYIEMGPPPILTERGWLVFYHGIDRLDNHRTYSLGAALFAIDNPLQLIWRSSVPLLEPTELYEVVGMIDIIDGGMERLKSLHMSDLHVMAAENRLPKAIFCCGAILEGATVRLYYSGGDTVICTATVDLETIFLS